MFVTAAGYIGLGSPDIKIGDEICVSFDASMPLILRPTLETLQSPETMLYSLVGECYVHGLMQGKAIDMWEAGELSARRFSIV